MKVLQQEGAIEASSLRLVRMCLSHAIAGGVDSVW